MQIDFTDKVLELTKKLISFESVSPNQAGCLDYIANYLSKLGFTLTWLNRGSTSNLYARLGSDTPLFAFAGHIDVVPPGDMNKWNNYPFDLTETDGKLYGRGISDMKGGVAAFIAALENYIVNKQFKKGSIALLLTSDEETSAIDGTPVMVEYLKQQNIKIDYCMLGEPSSINKLGDTLKTGRRGSLTGHLEILGKQGHIAFPNLCQNPIHLFAEALHELSTKIWDNGTEYFPQTSLQFANLHSGVGVDNVIPGSLFASFNCRYNDLHDFTSLTGQIEDILKKYNLNYNINWKDSAKPFLTKPGKLIEVVKSAIYENLNILPELKTDGGTSDGRFLIDVSSELLEFGLTNLTVHQINENICKADLIDLTKTYSTILNKIFND